MIYSVNGTNEAVGTQRVVSLKISKRAHPIYAPKYYNPFYGDPQNGTPNFPTGNTHIAVRNQAWVMFGISF